MATTREPATPGAQPAFKKVRQVTLPVLKLDSKEPRYLHFIGPMHLGEAVKAGEGKKQMEPATVAHCLDMTTGEEGQLICSAMLASQIRREYPDDSYVGRGFELTSTKVPDKKYNIVSITEVESPDNVVAAAAAIRKAVRSARASGADAAQEADSKARANA